MSEIWLRQKEVGIIENIAKITFLRRFKKNKYKNFRYVESEKGGGKNGKRLEIALSSISAEGRARYYGKLRNSGIEGFKNSEITDAQFDGFDRQPQWKKDEALRWLKIIEAFEAYAKNRGPKQRVKAARDFVKLYRIDHPGEKAFSHQTLFRKITEFRNSGIEGLLPQSGATHNFTDWPEEAKAWLWQRYCNINQPTATWCIAQLKAEAKKQGWRLPSTATMRRYLERIPQETRDRWRKGEKYWREHYLPSVLRDYEQMSPGELYVADHAQINVAVKHPLGRTLFPWITAWKDMKSRKILGWVLADVPSSNTINLSLKYTIEKYGASEHAVIDNGRDFSAKHFTGGQTKRFRFKVNEDEYEGVYKLLGIDPHFCIPANARAKNIERWFWTQEQNFQKAFPTYRGNNIQNRPEGVDKRIAKLETGNLKLEWDEMEEDIANYIETYNQDHRHQGHGMNGRSPNEVWNEYFATHAQRRVSPTSLRLLMMKSRRVKVGRFGIVAFGERYRSAELMEHQKEYVVYRYDPADLSILYIYTEDNEYLCMAERTHRTAWNDEEAYQEIKAVETKRKRALKAEREAAENLIEVEFGYQKQEPSGEHPDQPTKVVRVLRTPLDGVQGRIEQEEQDAERKDNHVSLEDFREQYMEDARRRLEERQRKREEEQRPGRFFKLTIPGGN